MSRAFGWDIFEPKVQEVKTEAQTGEDISSQNIQEVKTEAHTPTVAVATKCKVEALAGIAAPTLPQIEARVLRTMAQMEVMLPREATAVEIINSRATLRNIYLDMERHMAAVSVQNATRWAPVARERKTAQQNIIHLKSKVAELAAIIDTKEQHVQAFIFSLLIFFFYFFRIQKSILPGILMGIPTP